MGNDPSKNMYRSSKQVEMVESLMKLCSKLDGNLSQVSVLLTLDHPLGEKDATTFIRDDGLRILALQP